MPLYEIDENGKRKVREPLWEREWFSLVWMFVIFPLVVGAIAWYFRH